MGCQTPVIPQNMVLLGDQTKIEALDPAKTPFHGWGPVDDAISSAALEMLIIARPIGDDDIHNRAYTLKSLHGRPGEIKVVRHGVGLGIEPSEGLTIECRIGRRGHREMEDELLEKIARALAQKYASERE